jgi:hypothetical protein
MRGADLTQMQRSFVTALVRQGCNPTQAARIAGYSTPRTAAYDLLRSPSVQTAVAFERSRYVSCELANIATATLKEVMVDPAAAASARVAAARTVLEMAGDLGRNRKEAEDDRALSEMSAEDLTKLIDRWEGERAELIASVSSEGAETVRNQDDESPETTVDLTGSLRESEPENKKLAIHALGKAFAKVGSSRGITEWENIGAELIAKAKTDPLAGTVAYVGESGRSRLPPIRINDGSGALK